MAHRSGDEFGVFSMRCIPVSSIKNSNGIFSDGGEGLEEPNEATFIFDLNTVSLMN
jgi:hypothetical protein